VISNTATCLAKKKAVLGITSAFSQCPAEAPSRHVLPQHCKKYIFKNINVNVN